MKNGKSSMMESKATATITSNQKRNNKNENKKKTKQPSKRPYYNKRRIHLLHVKHGTQLCHQYQMKIAAFNYGAHRFC